MPYYKRFFEISFDVMCVVNATHFIEVNDALCRLLGYTREEILARSHFDFMHPEDVEASKDQINSGIILHTAELSSASIGVFFENRYITKAGKTVWLRWTAHRDRDGDGTMHCVAKDITLEKIVSTQLGKYIIDLQKSEREAKQSKEETETMAYAASHDLQEPLRTIMNWAAFLRDDYGTLLPPEGQEMLKYILESATRGRALVMDLLQLSRVGREQMFDWVNMNDVVDKATTDVEFTVRETQATIVRDPLPTEVWGDASLLRLLVKNLLSNAMKFSKPGERPDVRITVEETEDTWVFSVRDRGIGIDPAFVEKVFGVFTRLDQTRAGTGIGLAICQKIVKMHEGIIYIESTSGSGATVRFELNKVRANTNDGEHPEHTSGGGSPTGREGHHSGAVADVGALSPAPRVRRLGSFALLAESGALRDRPSHRPSSSRSQSSKGVGVRGPGRSEE